MLKTETYILYSLLGFLFFFLYAWLVLKYLSLSAKWEQTVKIIQEIHSKVFGAESAGMGGKDEKRFKYRAKSHLIGTVIEQNQSYATDILDLSKTGALIQCSGIALVVGQVYAFRFALDGDQELELMIKPVRVSNEGNSKYGVLFQNASVATLREISLYVSRAAQNELSSGFDPYHV